MATKSIFRCMRYLSRRSKNMKRDVIPRHHSNQHTRSMATITDLPAPAAKAQQHKTEATWLTTTITPQSQPLAPKDHVLTTIYHFPTLEPISFATYPHNHLHLPLRKDILHRAVIYEGDSHRAGTASTKWRNEVHGSHKKLYQQKGTGRARVGDKQSPIRRGGGVAFGPKPRDFSTKLNRKIYDLAWRTALSYRWKKGQLIVVDELRNPEGGITAPWYLRQIFEKNGWGNADKRSLLVTLSRKTNNSSLLLGIERIGEHGRMLRVADVDVKDLLEMGRIVIEKRALDFMLKQHSSDLVPPVNTIASIPAAHLVNDYPPVGSIL